MNIVSDGAGARRFPQLTVSLTAIKIILSISGNKMTSRPDPYRAFRFRVEKDGLLLGGFQSVGGLVRECKIEPYREGGINHYEHQLVTQTTYPPLVLKRGLFDSSLWDWHQDVINGDIQQSSITVILMNDAGEDEWFWNCVHAFPSKWTGAELDATTNNIATESIEFVHHGLTGVWKLAEKKDDKKKQIVGKRQ